METFKIVLAVVTGSIGAAGLALFLYGMFRAFRHGLQPPEGGERVYMRRRTTTDIPLFHKTSGEPTAVGMSWGAIRERIGSKEWRADPRSRTFLAMVGGAMLAAFGAILTMAVLLPEQRIYLLVVTAVVFGLIGWSAKTRAKGPPKRRIPGF